MKKFKILILCDLFIILDKNQMLKVLMNWNKFNYI